MNILFVGGGSGGHFFPCIELIKYFQSNNHKCFYIGGKNKYEDQKKDFIPCDYLLVELYGFQNNIKSGYKLLKSYFKSKKIIKKYLKDNQIDKVILFGNFESLIVGMISLKLKIPYYIHEQNSILGRSNNIMQRNATKIFTTFNNTKLLKRNNIRVGNPRMKKNFHIINGNRVLIIMGSLGSSPLIERMISYFEDNKKYDVTFVLGNNVKDIKDSSNYKFVSFFDHEKDSFNNYDFIITRGGATTLSEISGYAIPCLIIPSPYVINNHQELNAISFINEAGGEYIKEEELSKELVLNIIDKYLDNKKLYIDTQCKLYKFAINNSCERMYKEIL